MWTKKNILTIHIQNSLALILPIIIFYLAFKYYNSTSKIITNTALISASAENPSEALLKIKERFSDILIERSTPKLKNSENLENNAKNLTNNKTDVEQQNILPKEISESHPSTEVNYDESVTEFVPENQRGTIIEETFAGGQSPLYINLQPGYISNRTKINSQDLKQKINSFNPISIKITEQPLVLLFSTHATESFEPCDRKFYDKRYNSRSTDNDKNVTHIEDKIAEQLIQNGIPTIVDKTQHDFPSYNGSYNRSAETINEYLKKYPSIKVILDIHRDAIERENGERVKPITTINGKKAAQIMIISGCDDGTMNFPNWAQNLNFAVNLQQKIESSYPTLTRPIFFCYRKYNMNICPQSLLIEFGSNSNSLNEVLYSGELMGKALSDLLHSYEKNN